MPKIVQAGIRMKLLAYAAGVALPLAFVGLVSVWAMSEATRHQLEDSIKKQAEITAVAFKQWLEAQRTPLAAIAAYVTKPFEPDELLAVIGAIFNHVERTRAEFSRLLGEAESASSSYAAEGRLTEAETRIAEAVARGLSNKEIAAEFGVSVRTVENHVSHILAKKGFSNRVEIARLILEDRSAD